MPTLLKECVSCKIMRNAEIEFHNNGAKYADGKKRKRLDCIYCCRERRSAYFKDANNRAKINQRRRKTYNEDRRIKNRKHALRALYDISPQQYEDMRQKQNFCCLICETHESKVPRQKLYVDHCHSTNEIRGLLCAKCNSAIGLLKEDIAIINKAAEYLKKSKK